MTMIFDTNVTYVSSVTPVEYRQGTRHADVDTVEGRDGVIVTELLIASSELYILCMSQYIV
jgi:hypothetical protein